MNETLYAILIALGQGFWCLFVGFFFIILDWDDDNKLGKGK